MELELTLKGKQMNQAMQLNSYEEYRKLRNKLIPDAMELADAVAGDKPPETDPNIEHWANKWNKTFHTTMNKLAREKGLIS